MVIVSCLQTWWKAVQMAVPYDLINVAILCISGDNIHISLLSQHGQVSFLLFHAVMSSFCNLTRGSIIEGAEGCFKNFVNNCFHPSNYAVSKLMSSKKLFATQTGCRS